VREVLLVVWHVACIADALPSPRPTRSVRPFSWQTQWYAIAHERELPRDAPSSHTLLGQPLVLWHADGEWRAAHDVCPHRQAPLSRGFIDHVHGSSLTCAYHGWSFDVDGAAAVDPQGVQPPRCGLRMRRVARCKSGLVWVWADDDSEPLIGPPESKHSSHCMQIADWITLHLPVPFYALVENSIDAAHARHTHHGIGTLNRNDAQPYKHVASGERELRADEWTTWLITSGSDGRHLFRYDAPQHVILRFGHSVAIEAYITPVSAEETLLISNSFAGRGGLATSLGSLARRSPHTRALVHRFVAIIGIQDAQVMPSGGVGDDGTSSGSIHDGTMLPRDYDGSIRRIHRFIRRHGAPLPPAEGAPAHRRISAWSMHGCMCLDCRGFVRDARRAQAAWLLMALATASADAPMATISCGMLSFAMLELVRWMRDDHDESPLRPWLL